MTSSHRADGNKRRLVTGATGSLGRFVVKELLRRNLPVRALVRSSSNRNLLSAKTSESGEIDFFTGDLSDPNSLGGLLDGVSHVIHCAARLGDWGPWSEFESGIVATTRNLIDHCVDSPISRFVHVSSVAAYGHIRSAPPWTESEPLGQNLWWWDYYSRAKMLAEQQAQRLGERTVIVRPTWIYGPGDQAILPRILSALKKGQVTLLGSGDNLLNIVHAEDVAAATVTACEQREASGGVFNLCSDGEISQRDFFNLLANEKGWPVVEKSAPLWAAHQFGFFSECVFRALGRNNPPRVTRHGISLLTRPTHFCSKAAQDVLDWRCSRSVRDSLLEAVRSIQFD